MVQKSTTIHVHMCSERGERCNVDRGANVTRCNLRPALHSWIAGATCMRGQQWGRDSSVARRRRRPRRQRGDASSGDVGERRQRRRHQQGQPSRGRPRPRTASTSLTFRRSTLHEGPQLRLAGFSSDIPHTPRVFGLTEYLRDLRDRPMAQSCHVIF